MKRVVYGKDALRTLDRIPSNVAATIRKKVVQYASQPASLANNVKALKGEKGSFRLRVGDWRVVFIEDAKSVVVVRIAPRGGAYD
jgi:mRNA interferase RelE/StbE